VLALLAQVLVVMLRWLRAVRQMVLPLVAVYALLLVMVHLVVILSLQVVLVHVKHLVVVFVSKAIKDEFLSRILHLLQVICKLDCVSPAQEMQELTLLRAAFQKNPRALGLML
jgi:hypothetical protein